MLRSTEMMRRALVGSSAIVLLLGGLPSITSLAEEPVYFQQIGDVIKKWHPDQHLYVKGDIGVAAARLARLEEWLDANASHWTVVLMDGAEGERFHAADGRDYVGMDAVEYGLGYGLSNRTAFGEWTHPQTGESDGAVFALFLRERKFTYFGSDAQDRRGLGEAHWIGNLDQPAFRAMRGGGRIIDAVQDTVSLIDASLATAIQSEKEAVAREAAARERQVEEARSALAFARQSIEDVRAEAASYRERFPKAEGELVRAPLEEWERQLTAIEQKLDPQTSLEALRQVATVRDAVARFLNAYVALPTWDSQISSLQDRRRKLSESPLSVDPETLRQIDAAVDAAQTAAAAGDPDFPRSLDLASQWMSKGETLLAEALERDRQERYRAALVRKTAITVASLVGLVFAGFLVWLNRRRKKVRDQSILALTERQASVRKEMDRVMALFGRSGEILGDRSGLAARGYEGDTKALSEATLQYVDDLFVMSNEVKRVMEDAKELIYPSNVLAFIANLFSSARYERGIHHVTGKPLRFSLDKGLPLVLRKLPGINPGGITEGESAASSSRAAEASSEAPPDEIFLTFEQVFQAFHQRYRDAVDGLTSLEESLANVQSRLKEVGEGIQQAETLDNSLARASREDGYFDVPNFFQRLIPSLHADLKKAGQLSGFDPVQAIRVPLADASRKLAEIGDLAEMMTAARLNLFPHLKELADRLGEFGYSIDWIDHRLDELGNEANDIVGKSTGESVDLEIKAFESHLEELKQRTEQCVQLATRIQNEHIPRLDALAPKIADARNDLAGLLELPPERLLREIHLEPDEFLARARHNLEAARSMLPHGRAEAAQAALETMAAEALRAESILDESRENAKAFVPRHDELAHRAADLATHLRRVAASVDEASRAYSHAALLLDPVETNDGTIAPLAGQVAADMSRQLDAARRSLEMASSHHRDGRVLQAGQLLREADSELQRVAAGIRRIEDHLLRIAAQDRENEALVEQLEGKLPGLIELVRHPWVTRRTLEGTESVKRQLEQLRADAHAPTAAPNPLETAKGLAALRAQWQRIEACTAADREAFGEASRAVAGAERQLGVARQLVRQSETDQITDSTAIRSAARLVDAMQNDLPGLQRRLRTPHEDWQGIDDAAAKLQSDAAAAVETLRGELVAAERALQSFQQASQTVYRAAEWSGPWGMRVNGSPGVGELERARAALEGGNYTEGLQFSRMAITRAATAIEQAEQEVARRRTEEVRAAEAALRKRQAARAAKSRAFSSGDSSSWGSSSSSRSSPSHSTSSSSSHGGSSGFSRSGW